MEEEKKIAHWIPCPYCKKKTDIKIYNDTVLFKFPLYCVKCQKEALIDVMQLKMATSKPSDS